MGGESAGGWATDLNFAMGRQQTQDFGDGQGTVGGGGGGGDILQEIVAQILFSMLQSGVMTTGQFVTNFGGGGGSGEDPGDPKKKPMGPFTTDENLVAEGAAPQSSGSNHKGATVYVETDGIGHVYLEVDGVVFSYGRYNGSYSPSAGGFGPVGDGILMKETHEYVEKRKEKSPTLTYNFPAADAGAILSYMNKAYESGTSNPSGGVKVDTYYLIGNNCTTVTVEALQRGGVSIPMIQTPIGFQMYMEFPNRFGRDLPVK